MKTYSRHDFAREERGARAKVVISAACESKEQAFLDFVLSHDIGRVFIGFQKYLYQQEARSVGTPLNRLVVAVWAERSLPMADLKGGPKTT